jgi:hypothetical protein
MAEFERLITESGDENLRVEIARCLSRLERPLDALAAFETWLVFKGDSLAEAERTAIDAEMQAEWAKVGRLRVQIDRENVEIRLDGSPIGFSPLITPIRVPAGPHVVEVMHPRYEDQRLEVDALPGEITAVTVVMIEPPPPPPPPPPPIPGMSPEEVRRLEAEQAREEAWDAGGWNPLPPVMPWTWAESVPAGLVVSAGVGVGDLTFADEQLDDKDDSAGTGYTELRRVDSGLALPMPAFLGYRFHAAPMFALGGFFHYQMHETFVSRIHGFSNGKTTSLLAGLKLRVYFPLGLLEPFVGVGGAYARGEQSHNTDSGTFYHTDHTLQGAVVPLEVGLDVVPWDYITAGVAFLYGFGLWQEYCWTNSRPPAAETCHSPGDAEWSPDRADLWMFDFHVNFYLR